MGHVLTEARRGHLCIDVGARILIELVLSNVVALSLLARGESEGDLGSQEFFESVTRRRTIFEHGELHSGLLCSHLLLHDQVVEVSPWVDGAFFVKTALLHIGLDLFKEFFPHVQELGSRDFVLAISHVGRLVRQAGCLEKLEHN